MDTPQAGPTDTQIEFLRILLTEHAEVDCDVIEIREDVWIIHGIFPYEGEVPMAQFSTRDEALRVLRELRPV
jgi:hypothetical protein